MSKNTKKTSSLDSDAKTDFTEKESLKAEASWYDKLFFSWCFPIILKAS
jgi:hypothetical protein